MITTDELVLEYLTLRSPKSHIKIEKYNIKNGRLIIQYTYHLEVRDNVFKLQRDEDIYNLLDYITFLFNKLNKIKL